MCVCVCVHIRVERGPYRVLSFILFFVRFRGPSFHPPRSVYISQPCCTCRGPPMFALFGHTLWCVPRSVYISQPCCTCRGPPLCVCVCVCRAGGARPTCCLDYGDFVGLSVLLSDGLVLGCSLCFCNFIFIFG